MGSLFIIGIVAAGYYFSKDDVALDVETSGTSAIQPEPDSQPTQSQTEAKLEDRRLRMQAVFTDLKAHRQQLKSRANFMKSKIWNLELPAEQAQTVSKNIRQAYAYLKNPAMLGAYHEIQEMQREIKQIDAMLEGLERAEEIIEQQVTTQPEAD